MINRKIDDFLEDIKYKKNIILKNKRQYAKEKSLFYKNTKIVNPNFEFVEDETFDLGKIEKFLFSKAEQTPTNILIWCFIRHCIAEIVLQIVLYQILMMVRKKIALHGLIR